MTISRENKTYLRTMLYLAVPIIIQELASTFVNLLDSFMVGQLGLHAVTAVGLANEVFFLFTLLTFGVVSGSSIFIGQFWGRKDIENIHKTMGITLCAALMSAVIFAIPACFMPETIMKIYSDGNPLVIETGVKYLRIVWVSYFLVAIIVTINSAHKSTGQTRLPMFSTCISLIFSASLNYVFIFILGMGVEGAAISTVIARSIELILQFILIIKFKSPILGSIKNYLTANFKFVFDYFKISLPVILNELMWALGTSSYNMLYKFTGTEGQGAYQIANNLQRIFLVMGMAIGASCGIILANLLGANETEKAISYSRKSLKLAVSVSIVMGIFLLIVSAPIISLFKVDDDVKQNAFRICIVISIFMALKTINYITIIGVLRSGGDTKFCLLIDTCGVWLAGIPLTFFATYYLRLPIYWCVVFTYSEEIFKLFFTLKRTLGNKWAKSVITNVEVKSI